MPAVDDLKEALRASRIRRVIGQLTSAALSPPLAMAALGVTLPLALGAGAAVLLMGQAATFLLDRQQQLRESPYSFVLTAEKEFGSVAGRKSR